MAESEIPLDLLNPGQVFACLGVMEATEISCGACEGRFVWDGRETLASFRFQASVNRDPLTAVLDFLRRADVCAVAPRASGLAVKEAGVMTEERTDLFFPSPPPDSPSVLPIRLTNRAKSVPIEHWSDASSRDNMKLWAGAGGYSGAALARDALNAIRALDDEQWLKASRVPFDVEAPMSSSFRFDWRRDYVPLDLGFSLNEHQGTIRATGYPLVELLAAIGMQFARPVRVSPRNKLAYRYAAWSTPLPTVFARAVLGGASMGFPIRRFRMRLDWPGQENQARCIVDAQEE